MGKPRKRRPKNPDKRATILAAALELFAERGYHGTAMPLLAQEANVGAGTLYRYFRNKEDLVNALFRNWKGLLFSKLVDDFPVAATARQKFHEFWRRLCDFAVEYPSGFAFLELHHHAPYLDEESRALEQGVLVLVKSFVEQAQLQQVVKPIRPEVLMALVWGAFVGLVKAGELGYVQLVGTVLEETENVMWEAIRV